MRRTLPLLCSALVLLLAAGAQAAILNNGVDTGRPPGQSAPSARHAESCNVLWFGPGGGSGVEDQRISGLGFPATFTNNPADLSAANLVNYRILVVAGTGPGVIASAQAAIESFVRAGGGLLIHQPNISGVLDYTPAGFDVNTTDTYWCGFPSGHIGHIVNGSHPITGGLTDADLSGPFDWVASLGPGYALLAVNNLPGCMDPMLGAGTLDNGNVVYEDGNCYSGSLAPGSDQYWTNLFTWLCSGSPTPTHNETWGKLKSIYR